MRIRRLAMVSFFATTALVSHSSCRPAAYEIIKDGKKKNSPERDPNESDTSTPQIPPGTKNGGQAPLARVEVIWNNTAVTRVWVNEPTQIRPSVDTLDPDYVNTTSCLNPGIVKASFTIGPDITAGSERKIGCEALSVPYVFPTPGDYVITMTVTSKDQETATAKTILTVINRHEPIDPGPTIPTTPVDPSDPNQKPNQKPTQKPEQRPIIRYHGLDDMRQGADANWF